MRIQDRELNCVVSFLAGSIIGAGIALLFAPQSGRRTRRDIKYLGEKTLRGTEKIGMDLRHSLESVSDDISEKLKDGLRCVDEWKQAAEGVFRNARERAS
jgi:gas vesicle protein